jgi:hypothetical protein
MTDERRDGLAMVIEGALPETAAGSEAAQAAEYDQARADVDRIVAGLALIAAELPAVGMASSAICARQRHTRLRVFVLAAIAAGALAAAAVAVALRGDQPSTRSSADARFTADHFDYTPGGVGEGAGGFPGVGYALPGMAAIMALSRDDAWIVGGVRDHPTSWHWDGHRWSTVPMRDGQRPIGELRDAVAINENDIWAVGTQSGLSQEFSVSEPLIEHWNGARWSITATPRLGSGLLLAVSGSSPDNVWAVGERFHQRADGRFHEGGIRPLMLHWDGFRWRDVAVPWSRPASNLTFVSATSPDDVWVGSNGSGDARFVSLHHWDGSRWSKIRAPFGPRDSLVGFDSTSATDAWAVGGYQVHGHARTLAAHWDGRSWSIAPTPNRNTDSALTSVLALSPDNVWAGGTSNFYKAIPHGSQSSFPEVMLLHWNGVRWKLTPSPDAQMFEGPSRLTATNDGSAWATGNCYFDNVILRWTGDRWTPGRGPMLKRLPYHARIGGPPAGSCLR